MDDRLVLDHSVALLWFQGDYHQQGYATRLRQGMEQGMQALVPHCWQQDIIDALLHAERSGQIERAHTNQVLALLQRLPIRPAGGHSIHRISYLLRVTRETRLCAGKAAYLELATHENLPLASVDKALITAAGQLGIRLF